ncbi:biliverdin-producing heme oxygenase [Comamonadaceae bacterium OH3737_COT-264]|nr:biliverdin-producing heme oxygenase [Comamonadaceae bacterium OH3737_COT-264]
MKQAQPFNLYLKENSRATHDSVDALVMSVKPFENNANYIRFLQLQAVFHKIVDPLFQDPQLNARMPGLAERRRYDDVLLDLQDLGAAEKPVQLPIPQPQGAEAIGWLYCAEGSNLGAAFLFKDAQKHLGFDETRGARHLRPHADGRAKHWREFTDQLNQLDMSSGLNRETALKGALEAFSFYKALLREIYELA